MGRAYTAEQLARKREKDALWRASNPEFRDARAQYNQKWREVNRGRVNTHARGYHNASPERRLTRALRSYLSRTLRGLKCGNLESYVGCSIPQLRKSLEGQFQPGMTWENYGEWEVDHRVALKNGGSWHFSNLQPLWQRDNASKGARPA